MAVLTKPIGGASGPATVTSMAGTDTTFIWISGALKQITKSNFIGATITGAGTVATGGFTLTVPATGTVDLLGTAQTITAQKTFSVTPIVPGALNGEVFSLDSSATDTVLAAGASASISAVGGFAGLIILGEQTAGTVALYLVGGAGVNLIAQSGGSSIFNANDLGTANHIDVAYSGGFYFVKNTFATSRTIKVGLWRIRPAT